MRILLFVLVLLFLNSCATKKEVIYFQDATLDTETSVFSDLSKIQINDLLNIVVSSEDPLAAVPFNLNTGSSGNTSIEIIKLNSYLVDNNGMIKFPVLGELEVEGKSIEEFSEELTTLLIEGGYLDQPIVSVRYLNSKFTVLGEVKVPGTYTYVENQITLPQALGYAGDLTINGKRDDVMLIRQVNGKRVITHIDMTSTDWFDSEYYYVKQNDFIYVAPNGAKVKSAGLVGNVSTVLAAASVILSAIVIISR